MITFNKIPDNMTISSIFQYTYRYMDSRFEYSSRDVLPSRLFVAQRKKYKKNKQGKYNTPEEFLILSSTSAPQYYPYNKLKSSPNTKRQLKIKHTYEIRMAIQLSSNNTYDFNTSKIIWRTGSYKKPIKPNQKEVKTIYASTRTRLERKYKNEKDNKKRKEIINKELQKIRDRATYLNEGDYNARVRGVMLDCYYRCYPLQYKFGMLYGPLLNKEIPENKYVFFDKHMIAVIFFLLKKGILKY